LRREGNEIVVRSGVGSWQMMEEPRGFSGVERLAVKRRLRVCYSATIFRVCSYCDTVVVRVLKSVTRKRLVESVTD
jgi:hypothetical protein